LLLEAANPLHSKCGEAQAKEPLQRRVQDEVPEWWPRGIGFLSADEMQLIKPVWLADSRHHKKPDSHQLGVQESSRQLVGLGN
jgi:hypothetical protein